MAAMADVISFEFTGGAAGLVDAAGRASAALAGLEAAAFRSSEALSGIYGLVRAGRQYQKAQTKRRAVQRWNRKRRRR